MNITGQQVMTIFMYDTHDRISTNKKYVANNTNDSIKSILLEDFLIDYHNTDKKPFIFSVTIEAAGVCLIKTGLFTFLETIIGRKFLYYTILRDTFLRQQSLYNYLTSSQSQHELTYGLIKSETFEKYIASPQCEDCWLIRVLLGITDSDEITVDHYNIACSILDNFKISTVENIDELINYIFKKCYNISLQDINPVSAVQYHRSEYLNDKITFDDLDKPMQDIFLERTKYDRLLYKRYTTQITEAELI
jgi:hypothetical protein